MKERAAATTPRMNTPTWVRSSPRWNGRPRRGGSKWQSERKVRMTSALEIKLLINTYSLTTGYLIREMGKDGSCLFRAVADQVRTVQHVVQLSASYR